MLNMEMQVMTILGVSIIILLSLITMVLILLSIRKHQNIILDHADLTLRAVEQLQESILNMDSIITGNFKEAGSKTVIIESKLVSINDLVKDVAQAINTNHSKVMDIISIGKKPNKARRRSNTPDAKKYPPLDPR